MHGNHNSSSFQYTSKHVPGVVLVGVAAVVAVTLVVVVVGVAAVVVVALVVVVVGVAVVTVTFVVVVVGVALVVTVAFVVVVAGVAAVVAVAFVVVVGVTVVVVVVVVAAAIKHLRINAVFDPVVETPALFRRIRKTRHETFFSRVAVGSTGRCSSC